MVQILIKQANEADALAAIAGITTITPVTGSDGRLYLQFATDASGIAAAASTFDTINTDGYIDTAGSQVPNVGVAGLVYEDSLTASDGTATVFSFADPIRQLVCLFLGGIPQLATDVSVDIFGNAVIADNVTPPTLPVTALFYK